MRSVFPFVLAGFTAAACALETPYIEEPKPMWLWTGDEMEMPPCPDGAEPAWDGWPYEDLSPECGECTCAPAVCKPSTAYESFSAACKEETDPTNHVDLPESWDGACFAPPFPVPTLSYASILYRPPVVVPCEASPTPEPPALSTERARACRADTELATPSGFLSCMTSTVDAACPAEFPVRRVFSEHRFDHRRCSPCECEPPSELQCTVHITAYADRACEQAFDSATLSFTDDPVCHDFPSPSRPNFTALRAEPTPPIAGACAPVQRRSVVVDIVARSPPEFLCCAR
ncbi:hypothetical protein [Sorangium sp. So ce1024]|uniref:hypothetical protein n=1 Tax=Sorangium sp. So ce1024 TaxID=3133327 RepID=UPI003F0A7C85